MNENSEEMKTDDLIASLEDKGIKLWTDNGKLQLFRTTRRYEQ